MVLKVLYFKKLKPYVNYNTLYYIFAFLLFLLKNVYDNCLVLFVISVDMTSWILLNT